MAAWAIEWSATERAEVAAGAPLLAVVDAKGTFGAWVAAVCRTMRLRLCVAPDAVSLATTLGEVQPIAVVCADLGGEGRPVGRLLRLVANYDRHLPVLLMTHDDPETLGSIDAAVALWPLSDVQRVSGPVSVDTVLQFLARAGRRSGAMHMLAV